MESWHFLPFTTFYLPLNYSLVEHHAFWQVFMQRFGWGVKPLSEHFFSSVLEMTGIIGTGSPSILKLNGNSVIFFG